MAVFRQLYTYKFSPKTSSEILELGECLHLCEELEVNTKSGNVNFLYEKEDGNVYPTKISRNYNGEAIEPISGTKFASKWLGVHAQITVITKQPLEYNSMVLTGVREYYDYPKMIDDLEKNKIVQTKPSNGYLVNDSRKFWFPGEEEYEVDCLGTKLCVEITEKVKSSWLSIRNTSHLKYPMPSLNGGY